MAFKLRSGNTTVFKMMGSSPMKQDEELETGKALVTAKEKEVHQSGEGDNPRDQIRFRGLSDERITEILDKEAEREYRATKTGRGARPDPGTEEHASAVEGYEAVSPEEKPAQKVGKASTDYSESESKAHKLGLTEEEYSSLSPGQLAQLIAKKKRYGI